MGETKTISSSCMLGRHGEPCDDRSSSDVQWCDCECHDPETSEIANVSVETGEVKTRQVRRAEERASIKQGVALTKMAENAERVVLGEGAAAKMQRMRQLLFALVRREGRVRLTQAELGAVESKAGLDVKVQENGDLVVTYLRGSQR